MVLLIIFLSKTKINFFYVNITYVYVTEFALAEQRNCNVGILNVIKIISIICIKITYNQR